MGLFKEESNPYLSRSLTEVLFAPGILFITIVLLVLAPESL